MKPNYSLPCFRKTIVLDQKEYEIINRLLTIAVEHFSDEMTIEETHTINSIANKLASPSHEQNN